jgi:hypothetical protein
VSGVAKWCIRKSMYEAVTMSEGISRIGIVAL